MKDESDNPRPRSETDPRFPSGPWTGFWVQRGMGKQKMRLSLWFAGGKVGGSGADIVGRFSFDGRYDLKTGKCVMTKQYEHAHRIHYDGANEGDGMWLWGVWRVGPDRGGFHLWPEGEEDPTLRRDKAEREAPVDERKQVPVLVP
ncbi:MAG TPA: hypothetical protein VFE47_00610 [Tepidisphaeraceae bacterium]|jgi:hypothetical protein|nr:hypothetical protein [Tepidisphaeraceae bacterium]